MNGFDFSEVLLFLPFLAILILATFRLDELFSKNTHSLPSSKLACGIDKDGMPIFMEPDGRPLGKK